MRSERLGALLDRVEEELAARVPAWRGPFFRGAELGLVDAVFGPVFRYFDVFERAADLYPVEGRVHVAHSPS